MLAIGLDGFEVSLAEQLMDEGMLPSLSKRRDDAAHLLLEHGPAQHTGLGWEHFWSGLTPEAAARPTAVELDPATYTVWQEGARFPPFFDAQETKAVVFDTPYADLARAPGLRGIVAWGAHDPGITGGAASRPAGLVAELEAKVGPYPATPWTYAHPWWSAETCRTMGADLEAGIAARAAAARWLLQERIDDWELAVVVVSELHTATEGLWHGIDPDHPLHRHPSAAAAGAALRALYEAADRFVDDLVDATDASTVVVFSMGGMGPNISDVPSMALLPELVSRWSQGRPRLEVPAEWTESPACVPGLDGGPATWQRSWFERPGNTTGSARWSDRYTARLTRRLRRTTQRLAERRRDRPVGYLGLGWQPASWYQDEWPTMRAFALPSFYDGRIRINLRGREAHGVVDATDYAAVCDELEELVRGCVNPRTGGPIVAEVRRTAPDDPFALPTSGSDLAIVWDASTNGFCHPEHGLVGPVPYRRTGGHTGEHGFLSISGPDIAPGDHGVASSFDVAPTILDVLGWEGRDRISGTSLVTRLRSAPPAGPSGADGPAVP